MVDEVKRLRAQVKRHAETARRATAARNAAIVAMRQAGASWRQIAEAAELSPRAIVKIVQRTKEG
jgi:Homeodomain-like domain